MTRATPPDKGKGRRPASKPDPKHDDGPTLLDGPKVRLDSSPTNVDGPSIAAPADPHDTTSDPLLLGELGPFGGGDDDFTDDPTIYRGDKPPRPSSSRRLSPALMRIFQRRREQAGLSIEQVARLTGIEEQEILRFEGTNGGHRLVYDHAVLLAKVLGVRADEMPGMRAKEDRDPIVATLRSLAMTLQSGPTLVFEGASGERFGGDLERVGTVPHFAVRIGDSSLADVYPKGTLLGFVVDLKPQLGDVALLRQRKTRQLLMRRVLHNQLGALSLWQVTYPWPSAEWQPVARLQVVLPRP